MQNQQCLLHTKRKCYMNCCRIWKKSSKHCGHTGWIRRHKDCKWKLKINKVLRTTAKMIHELVLHTSKSHQNIVGTQANYESTKYSNEKSKSNKVLRTTAKMMHESWPDMKKVFKKLWEQAKYEGTGNANESSKATKYCTQQQKCCMNYCPIGKKAIKIKQGHKLSTKKNQTQTSAKPTKYCAQQQKWCMNYCRIGKKSWKHCGHAEWYDFSPSDTT